MRHDDLLREIRDAIRANTAATNALLEQRLLDAHPFYVYDAKTVHPALTPTRVEPGAALFSRTGQVEVNTSTDPGGNRPVEMSIEARDALLKQRDEKFLGVTGEEARQMKFPFMDE